MVRVKSRMGSWSKYYSGIVAWKPGWKKFYIRFAGGKSIGFDVARYQFSAGRYGGRNRQFLGFGNRGYGRSYGRSYGQGSSRTYGRSYGRRSYYGQRGRNYTARRSGKSNYR